MCGFSVFDFLFLGGGSGFTGGCGIYVCSLSKCFCVLLLPGRAPASNDACMSRSVSNVIGTFFAAKFVELACQSNSLESCCFPWLRYCMIYELVWIFVHLKIRRTFVAAKRDFRRINWSEKTDRVLCLNIYENKNLPLDPGQHILTHYACG